jgi:hypothetical protein
MTYDNTTQYRENIRKLFGMTTIKDTLPEEYDDEETRDEMDYDPERTSVAMDYIFEKTKDSLLFRELYDAGAGRMFSTNPEIGMAVLMSYDYLQWFHSCLVLYFTNPDEFKRTSNCFMELYRRIC